MGKKILLFCDGTWNNPEQLHQERVTPTNVVKFMRAVIFAKAPKQNDIFYHVGVGSGRNKYYGVITGNGILSQILEAYEYLSVVYEPDDSIYLFGFSRGAYAVRALAGFIYKVGGIISISRHEPSLLREITVETVQESMIYKTEHQRKANAIREILFTRNDARLDQLKKDFILYKPLIEMIGVWDTVGRLGFSIKIPPVFFKSYFLNNESMLLDYNQLLDVELNPFIKSAYQAIAINEDRKSFSPVLFKKPLPRSQQTDIA